MPRRFKPKPKMWTLKYERTMHGTTTVEAATAEAAIDMVNDGDFASDPATETQVDWCALSTPNAVKEETDL